MDRCRRVLVDPEVSTGVSKRCSWRCSHPSATRAACEFLLRLDLIEKEKIFVYLCSLGDAHCVSVTNPTLGPRYVASAIETCERNNRFLHRLNALLSSPISNQCRETWFQWWYAFTVRTISAPSILFFSPDLEAYSNMFVSRAHNKFRAQQLAHGADVAPKNISSTKALHPRWDIFHAPRPPS